MTATLSPLVEYLRQYGQCRTDEVFNGVTFWTDPQLETILLKRGSYETSKLESTPDPTLFTIAVTGHQWYRLDYRILNASGVWQEVVSTYAPLEQSITFVDPPGDNAVSIHGYRVNLWWALADLWDEKAAQRFNYVDFTAGHNRSFMQQQYDHCIKQRDYYNNKVLRGARRVRP